MPSDETRRLVRSYFAESLGCPADALIAGGVQIVSHRATGHIVTRCAVVNEIDETWIVQVPECVRALTEQRLRRQDAQNAVLEVTFWESVFGQRVRKVGPNWTGFADKTDFRAKAVVPTRPLTPHDSPGVAALAVACPEAEVASSDLDNPGFLAYGCESQGILVSMAAVANQTGQIANLQVACLPSFCRQGFASAAVTGLATPLVHHDRILGYSAYDANIASRALAENLGFWQHDIAWQFIPHDAFDGQRPPVRHPPVAGGSDRADMIGLRRHTVRLVQHQPGWAAAFAAEAQVLREALLGLVDNVQHVGSTAVRGLCAKPILDIAVAVRSTGDIAGIVQRLVALGYIDRGDGGREGGYLLVKESAPDVRTVHLHLVDITDPQWRNYLRFRDILCHDESIRRRYGQLKLDLAARFADDRRSYTRAKNQFIQEALSQEPHRMDD